jgi:biopolymer transport protein ExbB
MPLAVDPAAALEGLRAFLERGGPAMWAIAALSVMTLALILWKLADLLRLGAWSRGRTAEAVDLWRQGREAAAAARIAGLASARARLVGAAMAVARDPAYGPEERREEVTRVGKALLAEARAGLRGLDLVATIAPLLGLLGTVLGMIAAFQALQEAGARADPATLAGGIWEALLTTAAGMAVAIPASVALAAFEGVIDALRRDMEDAATRILQPPPAVPLPMAAQ